MLSKIIISLRIALAWLIVFIAPIATTVVYFEMRKPFYLSLLIFCLLVILLLIVSPPNYVPFRNREQKAQ